MPPDLSGQSPDHYQLVRLRGVGSFGQVYLAHDLLQQSPSPVALKLLRHPHLLPLLDLGLDAQRRHQGGRPLFFRAGRAALTCFTQAIHLDPSNAVVYNNRGILYYEQGDLAHALADYTEALRFNPTDPSIRRAYETLKAIQPE